MIISLVTREFPPDTAWGGIATYSFDIAQALVKKGHQVHVITLSVNGEAYEDEFQGIYVHRIVPSFIKLGKVPFFWRILKYYDGYHLSVYRTLRKLLKSKKIDIIESPNLHGETAIFQLFNKGSKHVPVVIRLHSCLKQNLLHNKSNFTLALRISHFFERMAVKRAQGISAVSKSVIKYNDDLPMKDKPISVIGNPLNVNEFNADIQKDPNLILCVGRLSMQKGAYILATAIPEILKRHPNAQFLFIGKNGIHESGMGMKEWILQKVGKYSENVAFKDHLERRELLSYYDRASVVIFPTLYESFGYITTESMAARAVVVASDLDGPSEIIRHNENGVLFAPGSTIDLVDKVNTLLDNPEHMIQLRIQGRKTVEEHYNWDVIADQVLYFYQQIITRN